MSCNCLIAQSGGPTTAINASLSGIIQSALASEHIHNIYGAINGVQGILNERLLLLNEMFTKDNHAIKKLKHTPAMFLGSCRFKLDSDYQSAQYKHIFETFEKLDIKYFFYIGGNDSMDTVMKLSKYAKENNKNVIILGIPKTIDNDLCGTDHTPGFGSAAKFVSTSILDIAHDSYIYDTNSVTIVEIMGRNAGWLTAASALARNDYSKSPDLIYLPEVPFSTYDFLNDIKELMKKKKNIIVAVSEGIKDAKGNYISASSDNKTDAFGHSKLSGTGSALEYLVQTALNCKVRSVELNVLQRSAMHMASETDLNEAFQLGERAVEYALTGITGRMVVLERNEDLPYSCNISHIDISEVANQEKKVPLQWINEKGNDIKDELIDYLKPLITGEPDVSFKNGLPQYMSIHHLVEETA